MRNFYMPTILVAVMFTFSGMRPARAAAVIDVDLPSIVARLEAEMKQAEARTPYTGFFLVCASGTTADMEAALAQGADPNAVDPGHGDISALSVAAMNNPDPGVVRALLRAGAAIDAKGKGYGRTALHMAVLFNPRPDVIKAIVDGGPDLEIPDQDMETALSYAIKGKLSDGYLSGYPNDEIILLLLEAASRLPAKSMPADRRVDFYTHYLNEYRDAFKPRYADTPYPSEEVIDAFLALGVVPHAGDAERNEAFREAAGDLDINAMKRLLASGAVPEVIDEKGNGILHYVMRRADGSRAKQFADVLELVLAAGVPPDPRNDDGENPLYSFARSARIDDEDEMNALLPVMRRYVALGVDIEARNKRGCTPIFGVTSTLGLPVYTLKLMCELGCDVNTQDNMGMTPLIHEGYSFNTFKDSEASESKGEWLLANFTALLDVGADPSIRDEKGKTAWDHLSPAARKHLLTTPVGARLGSE